MHSAKREEALSEVKENLFDTERNQTIKSTRRFSAATNSTSVCKKILKSLCEDTQKPGNLMKYGLSNNSNELTIRQIKLKQGADYLQKKNNKLSQQILALTQDLNTITKVRQEDIKFFQNQMEKSKKLHQQKNQNTKIVCELKKKIQEMDLQIQNYKTKEIESDKKLTKMKEILRKKQQILAETQNKLIGKQNFETIITQQRDEINALKAHFQRLNEKGINYEGQNELLIGKINQMKKEFQEMKGKIWSLEQQNKRLIDQCQQLQVLLDEDKQEGDEITEKMQFTIKDQQQQIYRFQKILSKLGQIEKQNTENKLCEIYKDEITQILQRRIVDKSLRSKLQKQIEEVIQSMQEGMNRVFMKIVANNL